MKKHKVELKTGKYWCPEHAEIDLVLQVTHNPALKSQLHVVRAFNKEIYCWKCIMKVLGGVVCKAQKN